MVRRSCVTALLIVAFSVTVSGFLTVDNLITLVRNVSTLGILGTAMAIMVIGGGIPGVQTFRVPTASPPVLARRTSERLDAEIALEQTQRT